jgi:hypothetical protein
MRIRGPHECEMRLAGRHDIVGEFALAGDERRVFDAANRLAAAVADRFDFRCHDAAPFPPAITPAACCTAATMFV